MAMNNPPLVSDVCGRGQELAIITRADESLEQVLRRFAEVPWLRGIFVTDDNGRYLGVITRVDLLYWTRLRLGTALRGSVKEPGSLARLVALLRAATAHEAVSPGSQQAAVRLSDPVDTALDLMLQTDLVAIPVLDDGGRIIGEITLSHVLRFLLDRG